MNARGRTGRAPLWLLATLLRTAAGVGLAAAVMPALGLGPRPWPAAVVSGLLFLLASAVLSIPLQLVLAAVLAAGLRRQLDRLDPSPDWDVWGDDDRGDDDRGGEPPADTGLGTLARPASPAHEAPEGPALPMRVGLSILIWAATTVALAPAALWVAVRGCGALGLRLDRPDAWGAYLVAALIVSGIPSGSSRPASEGRRLRRWAAGPAAVLLNLAGLALVGVIPGGPRWHPAAVVPDLLYLLALAVLFTALVPVSLPGRWGMLGQLPVTAVAVGLLVWATTWLDGSVDVGGAVGIALASVVLTVAGLPVRWLRPPLPPVTFERTYSRSPG